MIILQKFRTEINSFREEQAGKEQLGFNFFSIISDFYYRENFHSDILKSCLEIPEFFDAFIKLVKAESGGRPLFKFLNSSISREKHGRIDLCIIDEDSKNAIIIENKLNNAHDMPRQLPRYYESLTKKGYLVNKILYLSLTGKKYPLRHDWTDDDRRTLSNKISIMSSVRSQNLNLEEILEKALLSTSNIDYVVFFKQYKNLLNYLSRQETNNNIMDDFYSKIETSEDLNDLLALQKLIENLPKYRALRLRNHYLNSFAPFLEIAIWKDLVTYFDKFLIADSHFAIDILCLPQSYDVSFFDRKAETNNSSVLMNEKCNLGFQNREGSIRLHRVFDYPNQEKELYEFLDHVLVNLKVNTQNRT
ncbi:MAG: hypothetical protein EOO51_08435 [Flavobacterium sp.]|nr:MAG: hypothetical protein EOO51_08435 [Flavobacterium sp.]